MDFQPWQVDTRGRDCTWYAQPGVCNTDGEFYTPSALTQWEEAEVRKVRHGEVIYHMVMTNIAMENPL